MTEDVGEMISKRYFENAMREIVGQTYHQSIYLAKINLIWAADEIVIEDVEPMPFGQYIYSDVLSAIRERAAGEEQKRAKRELSKIRDGAGKKEREETAPACREPMISGGVVRIELGIGGTAGKTFYSTPVVHGLGPGKVTVVTGVACGGDFVCYGSKGIFRGEGLVSAETAVRVNVKEGTFVVGLRLAEATKEQAVDVRWTAFCDGSEQEAKDEPGELFIKPDMVYLSVREDYYFEAVVGGVSDGRIIWSVREAAGGSVDENGMYTAPNTPGVYEIVAASAADPKLTASAFAVVRDIRRKDADEEIRRRDEW